MDRRGTLDDPAPDFGFLVQPEQADDRLIEALLKRVGGGAYDREFIVSRGLDPDVENPDMPIPAARPQPTPGIRYGTGAGGPGPALFPTPTGQNRPAEERTTTRYLAELDGPYLVAHAAGDPAKGTEALKRYLSVYTNYNYPEYRFSTLWLLLGFVVRFPRADGSQWVQGAVVRILDAALGGGSVEFEQGLAVAVSALRAQAGDAAARTALEQQAHRLMDEAMRLKPGRDRDGSDIWAHHKRLMLASAQSLGWLLGEDALAGQVLQEAAGPGRVRLRRLPGAGLPGPGRGDPRLPQAAPAAADIEHALEWAQRAAHNVQDPTFCARMTARVNAMRKHWWQGFDLEERARRLAEAGHQSAFAALHRVGHQYLGRRPDALQLPPWVADDRSFEGLERLYQRRKADFLRLNGGEQAFDTGEVAVPDPGFVPHLAARLAAEVLAQADHAPLPPRRLQLLRALVPHALPSPTALDAVLTRLVLGQARRAAPPDLAESSALEAVLARRPPAEQMDAGSELIAGPSHSRLPA